jgi:hypothetical protein
MSETMTRQKPLDEKAIERSAQSALKIWKGTPAGPRYVIENDVPALCEEVRRLRAERKAIAKAIRTAGARGPSELEVEASGRCFADWEAGFTAACDIIRAALAEPAR